ncbi:MAG: hypothetical protein KAS04_04310 [Candidatus Aenigmarchaeota archaeon]|nr:hypothetical protein [Candidatus Aenigmarchaeota archaeon]
MRVSTGIPGLDNLIEGGFEEGSVNLISGKTGTGKSIFSAQFIHNGVKEFNEKGLYITTGDTIKNIKKQAAKFGWDLDALEKEGNLKVLHVEPYDVEKLMENISLSKGVNEAKRVVIDSISMFELYMQNPYKIRKSLFSMLQKFKDLGKTVLVVAEVQEDSKNLSRFGVVEFMVDSVILLQYLGIAKCKRSLNIRKMRMTNHSSDIHPFEIGPKGIELLEI